jgi:zinc protease
MKILVISLSALLFAGPTVAQKAPLPKDLPPYGPAIPLASPVVKSTKLDNGLTVWLVSEPGFPKVAITLTVRGGFASDPADRPGISDLLAKTIDQGTGTRTAKQIAQDLQGAGGDLTASPGKDSLTVSTSFLSSRSDKALAVFADVVRNAGFPDAEVTLAKRNTIDDLKQKESQPSFLASRAMGKVLFGNHPYHVTSPTEESIAASSATDLRRIYAERFRPDQALLVAVGDFENERMLAEIKSRFDGWEAPTSAPVPDPEIFSATPQHVVFIVPRPASVQTTLQLGMFGPRRSDSDYEAALVANAIYGGTFGSRLTSNIREDKGYTYSPFASLQPYRAVGMLVTQADVRNEVTGPTFNEITYELNRLATTSPTPDELKQAERFLVGIEAIRLQLRESVANELARLWINGLSPEEIGVYGRKVASTTANDVDAAARKYFPAAKAAVVAVGEENVIREAVAPFGISVQVLQ